MFSSEAGGELNRICVLFDVHLGDALEVFDLHDGGEGAANPARSLDTLREGNELRTHPA